MSHNELNAAQVGNADRAGMAVSAEARAGELAETNARLAEELAHSRAAEAALRQAADRYRNMFESATVGIFQTTPEGQYLTCNPALACIYGYDSPADLMASIRDIQRKLYVREDSRPAFARLMAEQDRVSGFEAEIYRKDGSIIWISETARRVCDERGKLLYYEGFVTNITAERKAADDLRESEERYALAVRGANDGLWDWDLRRGEMHFSARWKEMLGHTDGEIGTAPDEWFKLKELGLRLNIDDFGTGYSSLAYLQRFPVDTMKIDRSFIARMVESPENVEIIRTIVQLAHSLDMNMTAEGIENAEQLSRLEDLNCENAQGYLFSRPLDVTSATWLLGENIAGKEMQVAPGSGRAKAP